MRRRQFDVTGMTRTIFSNSLISSARFCRRPAVSTNTMSMPSLFAGGDRIKREAGRITARLARDHLCTRALAPNLQLIDRGGAEGIARDQHHRFAFGAQARGEFADRRCLAGTVDTGDKYNEWLVP